MMGNRHKRAWLLMASIAIVAALVLMLMPHGHADSGTAWLSILPVLFVGLVSPLSVTPVPACFDSARAFDPPTLQPSFQRPPPLSIA